MENRPQSEEKNRVKGWVEEALPNLLFRVKLENGKQVLAYLAGKLRVHHIKILPGDKVLVETTPYDDKRGRIVYRMK